MPVDLSQVFTDGRVRRFGAPMSGAVPAGGVDAMVHVASSGLVTEDRVPRIVDETCRVSATVDSASHTTATASSLLTAVMAAVASGARSWAAVGREAGCSRTWAVELGRRHGLSLAGERGARETSLNVRIHESGRAALDTERAFEEATTGRPVTRSELARRLMAEALEARRRARER